ncbi:MULTISPECIES: hypothetical protein [Pseudomonas]|uniref:hypothetical protein n=1 Tax=Pseudomonas TaxID=286 RepID=UPI001BEB5617|nr:MULTISPECIES: hypothetical protein [Pseudomonas]MBT2341800.1 hypothetical protein [Pseudomonas fluorescens]MCD4530471.1 hypothetical protein [Pseudomonas sp. C3-2018]
MSNNSLESLLAWMKDTSQLSGWGMIVALERSKANLLMRQEYIRRFDTESYLPPIRGEVQVVENRWVKFIHDFVMDVPLLSFENADLNDSKAMLTMSVIGGSQLTLTKESVGWKAVEVDEIDPLQGPKLYLDLLLHQVPGNVDDDGRIILDLKKSDNFRLTFGQTAEEQRLGGSFFKDLFNQLPDDKRIWPLGRIERGTSESMRPQSFGLRTQASGAAARDPSSAEHGNGAIVAFVRMEGNNEGGYPSPNSGFRYLIPDDGEEDYSATVLFNVEQLSSVLGDALLDRVAEMIGSDDFHRLYSSDGQLMSAVARAGGLTIASSANPLPGVGVGEDSQFVIPWITRSSVFLSANSKVPFTLVAEAANKFSVHWVSEAKSQVNILFVNGVGEELWPTITKEYLYVVDLQAEFELMDVVGTDGVSEVVMRATKFELVTNMKDEETGALSDGTPLAKEEASKDNLTVLLLYVLAQLGLLFVNSVQPKIKRALQRDLNIDIFMRPFIDDLIKMNFGRAIQGHEIRSPYDIGFFGRVNPTQTSFIISPMQPLMPQDDTLQFSTAPDVGGVLWTVENLARDASDPGAISADGLYRSPPAASIEGRFKRVRITATDPGSDYYSSALVTVLVNELSVHPLIQICDLGSSVELAAGTLGEGELIWSIKNPVANESGEVRPSVNPEGDHTYHHGPEVSSKTYVLDEVEVKNRRTSQIRSVHVLALQRTPGTTIRIVNLDISQGQVQLEAIVNSNVMEAEWSLPLGGPGSIDSTGLYRTSPTATERFVLIFALVDGGAFGKFEGHLILPLPLIEFPQVLEVLSQ